MKLRIYKVFVNSYKDGKLCFLSPAKTPNDAKEIANGIGEVFAVLDATSQFTFNGEEISTALFNARFSQDEIDILVRALVKTGLPIF